MDPGGLPDLDLRRYLDGLRRRKATVVGVVVLAIATAITLSVLQDPLYAAKADILLQPSGSMSLFVTGGQSQLDPKLVIDTEIKMIESRPVRMAVEAARGRVAKVHATRVEQTLIIRLTGHGDTPRRAADVANAYADSYIQLRQSQATDDLAAGTSALLRKIDDLQTQIDEIDLGSGVGAASEDDPARADLAAHRAALSSQQILFRQRLDELQVDSQVRAAAVRVVVRASPQTKPIRPTPIRNVLLATVVGLLFGVGLACLQEFLDDSVRTQEDLARLSGLPVLGAIPSFSTSRTPSPILAVAGETETGAAEAYRALRTSVQLLGVTRPLTTIQFTSPGGGVGKTTTVSNLATVLVAAGHRVAVVDSDLRRPRLHEVFAVPNDKGLTAVLVGDATLAEALTPVPGHPGLQILTAGVIAPNPSELLSLKRTAEVIFELQSRFDVVLIDSPPVLPVTDAIVMSEWVEAVVVVVASGQTKRNELRNALDQLKQATAPLAGAVLNRTAREPGYSYSYGYGTEERRRRPWDEPPGANGHGGTRDPRITQP